MTGVRESAQSWRELLLDIKQRGLEIAPDLAVGDSGVRFLEGDRNSLPGHQAPALLGSQDRQLAEQGCLSVQLNIKADIREIYGRLSMPQSALGFAQFPLERAMWLVAAMMVDVRGD